MVIAWEEVKQEVIVKYFKNLGLYPEEKYNDEDDDPLAGEKLMNLDELVAKVSGETDIDALTYITDTDHEAFSYEPRVDTSDPNWWRNLRTEIIESHTSMKK